MPVLLLAQGDQASRTLLRNAIEARYGLGPPALETLTLRVTGRQRTQLGPMTLWAPLDATASFKFPLTVRWTYTSRRVGLLQHSDSGSFVDPVLRRRQGDQVVTDDAALTESAHALLWAYCAMLLIPLSEAFVELKLIDDFSFDAVNTEAGVTVRLRLNPDYSLASVSTDCINPASGKVETFTIKLAGELALLDDLILPRELTLLWNDAPAYELTPVSAVSNEPLDDGFFRLEHD